MNKNALTFFENMANSSPSLKSSKLLDKNDFSDYDAKFILQHANADTEILDLATGTGITLNKYYDRVKHVTAVEKFKEFTDFIVKSPNVDIINSDIKDFETDKKYDLILMFGIISYFDEEEAANIYQKYKFFLKENGKLIIKNQFGKKEDVTVNGYSEELQREYFSQYRYINKEIKILESLGYKNIETTDVYPPECNRWDNTHFYAIIAGV